MNAFETPETPEYQPSPADERACRAIDSAFSRNKAGWADDHARQHRLFDMVLAAPNPKKPDIDKRSNIKTGTAWMVHQVIFSILKNSLLTLKENVKLTATQARKIILGIEEIQQFLDRLVNDQKWPIYKNLKAALFDLIAHGTGVLRPYYRNDFRMVFDGEQDQEILHYSGPDLPYIASWDTYPTAGATCIEECHEIIFYESYYPHELRDMERAGLIKNVDEVLRGYKAPESYGKGQAEVKEPRVQKSDLETDSSGRIGVLVHWGLYPLYEDDDYIGSDGEDRSKVEVECLMIKPVGRDVIMYQERNEHYHQQKASIFAKNYDIPGLFWGESIFGLLERMFVHQEDWFNIIQDSANMEVYRDRVFSSAIDQTQREMKGIGRDYVVPAEVYKDLDGKVMKYLERGPAILPDVYEQRNYIDRAIQEIGGIWEFKQASAEGGPKTATEIQQLAASLNVRFEQMALDVGGSLLIPALSWCCSMLSSDQADDEFIAGEMGTPINIFKQFTPMMPNPGYRIELEGSMKSVQNAMLQKELTELIEQAKTIMPGPDENGELVQINPMAMFLDKVKLSKLSDTDRYKIPWIPPPVAPIGPDGQPAPDGSKEEQGVAGG